MSFGKKLCLALAAVGILAGPAAGAEKEMLIKFRQAPGPAEEALIRQFGGRIEKRLRLPNVVKATVPEEALERLGQDPAVVYIEENLTIRLPDRTVRALSTKSAAAPLAVGEYEQSWGVRRIGAEFMHDSGITGRGVKIAVLDTGIDYNHPELKANYKGGVNLINPGSTDPRDDATSSHGTHVAGIIAAARNGAEVVGVAPDAELYAVKILGGDGRGDSATVAEGILWAVDNGMDIINISAASIPSTAVQEALQAAENAGILVVAAAGNESGQPISFPASFEPVIAVTATDQSDNLAPFSNQGPQADLAAPGVRIKSTFRVESGSYGEISGTSQAAPHVTGLAALLLSADPLLSLDGLRLRLQELALDLGAPGRDPLYGYGLAQALPNYQLTRSASSPARDARTTTLANGTFDVVINNAALSGVMIRVFDQNGAPLRKESRYVRFRRSGPATAVHTIDASSRTLKVSLVPVGRRGAAAKVLILR